MFAVRLDTFDVPQKECSFYIGTNDPATLTFLRREMLSQFTVLPDVGEYIHRDVFDIADKYGKDTFLSVKHLGTDQLPKMFAMKGRIDAYLNKLSFCPSTLLIGYYNSSLPSCRIISPNAFESIVKKYEHHLILKMGDEGIDQAKALLQSFFNGHEERGGYFGV